MVSCRGGSGLPYRTPSWGSPPKGVGSTPRITPQGSISWVKEQRPVANPPRERGCCRSQGGFRKREPPDPEKSPLPRNGKTTPYTKGQVGWGSRTPGPLPGVHPRNPRKITGKWHSPTFSLGWGFGDPGGSLRRTPRRPPGAPGRPPGAGGIPFQNNRDLRGVRKRTPSGGPFLGGPGSQQSWGVLGERLLTHLIFVMQTSENNRKIFENAPHVRVKI
jgi:hypothetical protein